MNLAKISGKLNEQIRIFSGKVSKGLPKVGRRFVEEMLYGMACEQSLHLSKIARSLSEKIPLIKTINRLSFELSRPELWQKVAELGWTGMLFPESYGGYGGAFLDLAIIFEVEASAGAVD